MQGGKGAQAFDAAFEKYAQALPKEYKDNFKKVTYAGPKSKQGKINLAQRSGGNVQIVKKAGGNKTDGISNLNEILSDDKIIEIKENPKDYPLWIY